MGIDLHGTRHAGDQAHTIRYLIDVDTHRYTLRKPHPCEDRIYRGEPRWIRLCVRDINAAGDAADMATNQLPVAHQLDGRRVAVLDPAETGLLEVAVDPIGISVNEGNQRWAQPVGATLARSLLAGV